MSQAIFITGFNNWGKTTIIQSLFNHKKRYSPKKSYSINGISASFSVETHSNDDYWGQHWVNHISRRLSVTPAGLNLLTALCPTIHLNNDFVQLLSGPPFNRYAKIHIFLIKYKYEHHAELMIANIIKAGSAIPNVNFVVIDADKAESSLSGIHTEKLKQIVNELKSIFP